MKYNVVILGTGESGMGAAQLAFVKGLSVFVSDAGKISEQNKATLESWNIIYEEGYHTWEEIKNTSLLVKSPGIPDKSLIIKQAHEQGIEVISEIEFAYRNKNPNSKIIAITGTNGKTTTTLLTYHLLKSAGLDAVLAGNVGISLAGKIASQPAEYYVVEVSSFQLDGILHFKPNIAVLLNITPDHLDRYDYNFSNYVDSKFRIVKNTSETDIFIYNEGSIPVKEGVAGKDIRAKPFIVSLNSHSQQGAFRTQEQLRFNVSPNNADINFLKHSEIGLIGKHNSINVMSAVLCALAVGVEWIQIKRGLGTFKNAAHRLEKVKEIKSVLYINDSKATNVDSVYYALDGIDTPIIWIAGGVDKGNDYNQIDELVSKKVKALVSLGVDNQPLDNYFKKYSRPLAKALSMSEALQAASNFASAGDTVLLSPACASFDLFKNYEDRGDQFKNAVMELIKNKD